VLCQIWANARTVADYRFLPQMAKDAQFNHTNMKWLPLENNMQACQIHWMTSES